MEDRLDVLLDKIGKIDISSHSRKTDVVECLELIHEELTCLREEVESVYLFGRQKD